MLFKDTLRLVRNLRDEVVSDGLRAFGMLKDYMVFVALERLIQRQRLLIEIVTMSSGGGPPRSNASILRLNLAT